MTKDEKRLDQLTKRSQEVSDKTMKAAIEKQIIAQQSKVEEALIEKLEACDKELMLQVERLKLIRKAEKAQREVVKNMDNAYEAFKRDANINKVNEGVILNIDERFRVSRVLAEAYNYN